MPNCFVIMPFKPELHYMYLYMQQHIESTFDGVSCERGDATILTVPVLDKIIGYIQKADVVVADCTDRNPNVFYELGIAHALDKKVILITSDVVETAPTDIRAFEFIHYTLDDHVAFFERLDRALRSLFSSQFDELYTQISLLFDEFRAAFRLPLTKVDKETFSAAAAAAKGRSGGGPPLDDTKAQAKAFLPIIVQGPTNLDVMLKINQWIEQKFGDKG